MKIRMRVLAAEDIQSTNCVMLGKLGDVYSCIENAFHPHCGSKEEGYPEIYSVIDWMISNRVNRGCKAVNGWLAQELRSCYDDMFDLLLAIEFIFCGLTPSNRTQELCTHIWENIDSIEYSKQQKLSYAEQIDFYLNQNFLRVRSGGKLNSGSADSIYFRISSKGYDWHDVIEDFLWDVFKHVNDMPQLIWIGHDAETNPPEVVLFEGTPEELINNADSKIFAKSVANNIQKFV